MLVRVKEVSLTAGALGPSGSTASIENPSSGVAAAGIQSDTRIESSLCGLSVLLNADGVGFDQTRALKKIGVRTRVLLFSIPELAVPTGFIGAVPLFYHDAARLRLDYAFHCVD